MSHPMRVLSLMGQRAEKSFEEHFALHDLWLYMDRNRREG